MKNTNENRLWFVRGLRDGIPIALGYFAVAFTLGIAARKAGFTWVQAFFCCFTTNASAGAYAGISLIQAGAGILEITIMEAVANARYLLMSAALSQKFSPETPFFHRLLVAYDVTDEIFGISVNVPGYLNPRYSYGAMALALPGWAGGAALGVVMGNILPAAAVSALGVGIYGMFIAIVIPPARKSRKIAIVVACSAAVSLVMSLIPAVQAIPSGVQTIILTVALSSLAAIVFPIKAENGGQTNE